MVAVFAPSVCELIFNHEFKIQPEKRERNSIAIVNFSESVWILYYLIAIYNP